MPPKVIPFFYGTIGLNTRLDPERMQEGNRDNGYLVEFAQAVNVSVDDRGLVSLRRGHTLAQAGEFHSLFCDGGDCFAVQERTSDAAIIRIVSAVPFVSTTIATGLTKGLRMAWGQSNYDTFFSNGTQNGYIRGGAASPWPIGAYNGPDADLQFASAAPLASHIAFLRGGKVALAVGSSVFLNHAPFQYGLFSLRKGYIGFESGVTMLCPVRSGFFASDGKATWFFRQTEKWYVYTQELADDAPALEHSLAYDKVAVADLNLEREVGFGRVWASTKGICLGIDSGRVINLTKDKVNYPQTHAYGACLLDGTSLINTVY